MEEPIRRILTPDEKSVLTYADFEIKNNAGDYALLTFGCLGVLAVIFFGVFLLTLIVVACYLNLTQDEYDSDWAIKISFAVAAVIDAFVIMMFLRDRRQQKKRDKTEEEKLQQPVDVIRHACHASLKLIGPEGDDDVGDAAFFDIGSGRILFLEDYDIRELDNKKPPDWTTVDRRELDIFRHIDGELIGVIAGGDCIDERSTLEKYSFDDLPESGAILSGRLETVREDVKNHLKLSS